MKRVIVKSMAETTAWRSHCQFITFIAFLFMANVIRQMAPLFPRLIQINYGVMFRMMRP